MRKQWKGLAAVLGGVLLALAQNGATPVKAAEPSSRTQSTQQEAAAETQLMAATDLHWNDKGQGVFTNPNSEEVAIYAYINGPGAKNLQFSGGLHNEEEVTLDLYHYIHETGTYTFKIVIVKNGEAKSSEYSEGFEYIKPDIQLPKPEVSVSSEGKVTCTLPEAGNYELGTDYGFNYELYVHGSNSAIAQRGIDSSEFNFSEYIKPDNVYYVRVRTISRDIVKYVDSAWSELIRIGSDAASTPQEEDKDQEQNQEEEQDQGGWKPSTPDEIKRFALCSSEEVDFTVDTKNAYAVTMQNSVQGEKCFVSFEAVLGDYIIGRTYNIFPSVGTVYQMDSKARITLNVPKTLQADNRKFRMISVTENGRPVILEDLDSNAETITFETDTYYAFALVYKDTVGSGVR